MKGVLQKIVASKIAEVDLREVKSPITDLMKSAQYSRGALSMAKAIKEGSGVIAEFKRASPSKGIIRQEASPGTIAVKYKKAGASAISVLTDTNYFQGSLRDLMEVRELVHIPILRKDFIINSYQIHESKAIGADCILLIAAILSTGQIKEYQQIAGDCGLEVLVEIHNERELDKLTGKETLIGINNRNLDTFKVDIENSIRLASALPDVIKIAESGLGNNTNLEALVRAGFDGFLVGESFMKASDPGLACQGFVKEISKYK